MKWRGFSLSILGLFVSSHVLAMETPLSITQIEPGDTTEVVQEIGEFVFHERGDFGTAAISTSRAFWEESLERFSYTSPDEGYTSSPSILHLEPKQSDFSLKNFSFLKSSPSSSDFSLDQGPQFSLLSSEDASLSTLDLDLGSSLGLSPLDLSSRYFFRKSPKPLIRAGITLPKVDFGHLGISKFFNERGIPLGKYDLCFRHSKKWAPPLALPSRLDNLELKTINLSSLLNNKDELENLKIPPLLNKFEFKNFISQEEKLYQTAIPDLTDEEIIFLFKHLTSRYPKLIRSNEDPMMKLEKLLQDERARTVILKASKDSEDPLSKAFESSVGILGNSKQFKTLFSADGFLEHLLSRPADEKGATPISRAFLNNIIPPHLENLTAFFENPRIFEHLISIPSEKYQSVVMQALISAVILPCGETILPPFYQSRVIFDHLVSCFSQGDLNDQANAKVFTKVGLLIALSEREEETVNKLLNEGVVSIIQKDAEFVTQVMKKAIEDRNPYLARKLLVELENVIAPAQIKEALQVPAIWEGLSDDNKRALLARAQTMDPHLTEEVFLRHHKQMSAYEHALVGHPSVVDDMEAFAFEGHAAYQKLLTKDSNPIEREAQKKILEREFLKVFPAKTAPWLHAEAQTAYDLRMFGQGIEGLVVELDVLPEHQREGLLHSHLGEETVYKEEAKGSRSAHNVGVTSLVAQMAPLATITSTTTNQLQKIEENIAAGKYPFINCSWGPLQDLKDADSSFSIFSSHKELNTMLGRSDVVFVKSAGNESASLSNAESTEDIAGKVFSALLNRLEPNQLTNLILAVNLCPTNAVSDSSNTPGFFDKIYRHTISAQGSKTFWLDEIGHHYRPLQDGGTSSAAPIITGAALLVQGYKPDFSPILVKACLLHSAWREFPIYGEDGNIKRGIYETMPSATWAKEGLPQEQFAFSNYGMGILNVKTAFEYADLLETYLGLRGNDAPVTFEEFENLRERLPLHTSRSSKDRSIELEI